MVAWTAERGCGLELMAGPSGWAFRLGLPAGPSGWAFRLGMAAAALD